METKEKVDELIQAIQEADESGDEEKYVEKMLELEDVYLENGVACLQLLDFLSAAQYFQSANEVENKLYEYWKVILNSLDKKKDKSDYNDIVEILKDLEENIKFSQAHANLSLGHANRMSRNPGEAIENFKEAKENFDLLHEKTHEGLFKLDSDYCDAMEILSGGLEELIRANYSNAKALFQRAKIHMENILQETLPEYIKKEEKDKKEYENLKSLIASDYKGCEGLYYLSDAKDQLVKGNFSQAKEQFEKLCDIYYETIEHVPDALPKSVRNLQLGEYHNYCGERYLAQGELLREQEKWNDALECYRKAKEESVKSADFCLKSGLPQAIALQESIMSYSSIANETYIRKCKKERELKNRIKELENDMNALQRSLTEAIKPAGVKVTTTQQMVSTVELNVQFIQKIENGVRQNIEKLVQQLDNLDIDKSKKDEIRNKADDVLKSREHGHQFLERAKKFTNDVNAIVKNLGEIAKPILPFISALSLLL